jgi:uncharacterized protein YodC (DUF2158 family)
MEKKFEIGQSVILKSGGPTMTITKLIDTISLRGGSGSFTGKIECNWFIENELKKGEFPQDALKLDE